MNKDESLPLIQTKNTLSSTKKLPEVQHNSTTITKESIMNFARLKMKMLASKMRKSNSTYDILFTPKSNFPNIPLEKNEEIRKDKNNYFIEESMYKLNYINRFKKIKTKLYKKKFYNNIKIKKIEELEDKLENLKDNKENENNENQESNDGKKEIDEEEIEESDKKINYFKHNIWDSEINLNNADNYDIGGENDSESGEENISEKNNYNIPENNELDYNKENIGIKNKNRKSLYLTDINSNSANETNISTIIQNNSNINKNKYNLKKMKLSKDKNPFNFTKYSSLDNISRFHKLYRNFKNLCRKHYINEKSPSFAFIKSCEKEKIVCNPLGLFKRKGGENILEMNNQHSGDRYINCLSSGLRYVTHLNTLEMSNNHLTNFGVEKLFYNIKQNDNFVKNLFKLNLSNNDIGEKGVENLINFIEDKSCQLENINIEGNNLGDNNINKLCMSIGSNIWSRINYFNAGKNKITKNSEKGLLFLTEKCTELVVLILRNNQINNILGAKLIINLKNLYSLKVFDISWNLIGNHLIYPLLFEEAVNFNPSPKNLYNNFELDKIKKNMKMNFNKNPLLPKIEKVSQGKSSKSKDKNITNEKIFEIKSVKVPKRNPSNFAIEFSNYIKNYLCPLVHLNISHNNLSYEDCQLISEESINNRSILGFHVDGNEMKIDPLGFLHPIKKEDKIHNFYSKSQLSYEMENFKGIPKIIASPLNKMRGGNNCWICQCWRETEFILDLKIKDLKPKYLLVKIHLDFENFEPCDMIYKKKCFRLIRMCPPGIIKFFYTLDGNPVKNCYKEYNYKIKEFEKPIKYTFKENYIEQYNKTKEMLLNKMNQSGNINITNYDNYVYFQEDIRDNEDKLISKTISIKNYGIRNILPNNNVITQDYQSTLKYSIPRPENTSSNRTQIPWKFEDSIWFNCNYNFEGETDEIIEKIFEFDFNRGNYDLTFIKQSEFMSAMELLKMNYKNIINCYIALSSYSGSNLWQITSNIIIDWLKDKCNFFDDRYHSQNMIKVIDEIYFIRRDKEDRIRYKTFPSNKYNLIRHTFLSLLINLSIDKYINALRMTNSPFDSLKYAMENNFLKGIQGYDNHLWRKQKYYNEEIDNYIKAFLPLLDGLYHTFSKKEKENKKENEKTNIKEKNNKDKKEIDKGYEEKMTQKDFNNFTLTFVDHIDYQITETPYIFHISKQLQIDEITNDDFLYLNLIEFCEALFRVIDILSPPPPEDKIEDWPIEKRKEQLLIEKIENIMPQLYKKIDHPKFNNIRDKFISPLKDQITSLYVIDIKSNSFFSGYEKYYKKENHI